MSTLLDHPMELFVIFLILLWLSAQIGAYVRRKRQSLEEADREDLGVILTATLTLLGLIIGFSFSMAVTRYDQRKNYEEAEANAIGTEYLRAGLLPDADVTKVRKLLKDYLDQRILFYTTSNEQQLDQINISTAKLQNELWSSIQAVAAATPTPTVALAAQGMNDVLNSQGYTQAAWWNRIPDAAWGLMAAIAICCNVMVGFNARRIEAKPRRFFILPLVVAISFFLIADLDAPRGGVILVKPQNLESLSTSMPR